MPDDDWDEDDDNHHRQHQVNYDRLTKPCNTCPFRRDKVFPLRPGRVSTIRDQLAVFPFPCHNTVDYGQNKPPEYEYSHCAGALILLEKISRPSLVMRYAAELGFYDRSKLDMSFPVYDSFEEMKSAMVDADRQLRKARRAR
jgi:hypothetical protein